MEEKQLVYCRIERSGTVLVVRRAAGVFLAGRWELPGGGVDPGEHPEAAAVREVGEETGLAVEVLGERSAHSWMDVAGRPLRIHARVYEVAEREPRTVTLNPEEHDDHAWVTPEQARTLGLADHFRAAVLGL
ncbi:NUDIX domain-containing protein [Nocardia seriolae]|uniref:7,8-dihydro-8-oxoguanine triphosphatase n=1 Tax=Nocardia seriolae TaxID=37332 RepID=A0ABC9Z104_9NOCA|nr:NUDIX hydrolase [Nocardia seriolae]OJF79999.1 7,8-dihydro-8-oxoguanine-triphosphatase [Nocardia seriolae]PSK28972.1 NUDIX hydrolase [Nocardia seriolae]QOW36066.1 NUDIX hydrolase [Nocardia seriolae]WNJ56502.1 NUDIX hydrolase [Nocardia seriolae]GAM49347.1 7,8-dihydro-8-oxoguanine triphosphatase [Nocardia seriolae]